MKKTITTLVALEQIIHDAAEVAAEDVSTAESRAAAKRLSTFALDRLAEARRRDLAIHPGIHGHRHRVRDDLARMSRSELLARVLELQRAHPVLGFAHHSLESLGDDDLRSMIDDAELAIHDA